MKKSLRLLVTSALVVLTFSILPKAQGMDDGGNLSASPTYLHFSHVPFNDFLKRTPSLYHQASIERYRESVNTLWREIEDWEYSKVAVYKEEIEKLKSTILVQKEALKLYELDDRDLVRQKIAREIEEIQQRIEAERQGIENKPDRAFREDQLIPFEERLNQFKKFLASLQDSGSILQEKLKRAEDFLKKIQDSDGTDQEDDLILNKKEQQLRSLYEEHVKGLSGRNVLSDDLLKDALKSLNIEQDQLGNLDMLYVFPVFARTMELPYVQTEADYLSQLGIIKKNLTNRLKENMVDFEEALLLARDAGINDKDLVDFLVIRNKEDRGKRFITDIEDIFKDSSSKTSEIWDKKNLKEPLLSSLITITYTVQQSFKQGSSWGGLLGTSISSEERPVFSPLESILASSSYGLLGLYITSLDSIPVTSWNATDISTHYRLHNMRKVGDINKKEILSIIVNNIYVMLGRHINVTVLEKIAQFSQKKKKKGRFK